MAEEDGPRRKRDSPAQGRFRSQKHSGKMLQSSIVDIAYMYVYAAHFSRKWNCCFEGYAEEWNALVQIKLITSSTHSLSPPHRPKKVINFGRRAEPSLSRSRKRTVFCQIKSERKVSFFPSSSPSHISLAASFRKCDGDTAACWHIIWGGGADHPHTLHYIMRYEERKEGGAEGGELPDLAKHASPKCAAFLHAQDVINSPIWQPLPWKRTNPPSFLSARRKLLSWRCVCAARSILPSPYQRLL